MTVPQDAPLRPHQTVQLSRSIAPLAGTLATLGGLWSVLTALLPRHQVISVGEDLLNIMGLPVGSNLFLGLALLILGEALRRSLRVARAVVIGVEAVLALSYLASLAVLLMAPEKVQELSGDQNLSHGLLLSATGVGAVFTLAILVLFLSRRRDFPARTRPGAVWAALGTLVGGLVAVVGVVFLLSGPASGTLTGSGERLYWAVRHTFGVSLPLGLNPGPHQGPGWLASLAGLLSAGVLLIALWQFVRGTRRAALMTPAEELSVRTLIDRGGENDSLAYFATRRDKSVLFSPSGDAAITYRVVGTVCLVSADPLGPYSAWPGAVAAIRRHAREHGWHLGVISASEAGARAYVEAGLRARPMGDEAVLDLEEFSLEGRAMRPVKRAVARVFEEGCTVTVQRHQDLLPHELAELSRLAEQWRGEESDRGFSMALNRLGDPADGRCVAVVVRDAESRIVALQSYVPWGARGLSLDLMRRSPQAPNGVNEAMVASLAEQGPGLGVRRISLNFAMFRSVFSDADKVGAGVGVRVADKVLGVANRFWQLESLYEANAKYLPEWQPRFVCFEQAATLGQIGIAAGVAEGFLPGPAPTPTYTGDVLMADPGHPGQQRALAELVVEQDTRLLAPARPVRRVPQQQQVRLDKLALLRENGMDGYPVAVPRTATLSQVRACVEEGCDPQLVSITGRVRALRRLGGVGFAVLEEEGTSLQALVERDSLDQEQWQLWCRGVDIGDRLSLTGVPGRSRSGEPSLLVQSWQMASKCLRPLPDERTGLTDPEARTRQRYLDLMVNREAAEILQARFRAVAAVRAAFINRGYLEVETPMLQSIHGGASARPFRTHINAYNADLYLRIAPELALKELCVAGMDRIFELNRCFRNEGADATHNPEFTSVEAYAAYEDYRSMRELTRELIIEVATAVHGEPVAVRPGPDGIPVRHRIDGEWPVLTVHEAVSQATGATLSSISPVEEVAAVAAQFGVRVTNAMTSGEMVVELYDALVEKQTTFPTFYTDFPLETSPLSRTHRDDPRLSERWDLVAWGAEIGTAYSELVDPVDQRERLTAQSLKAAAGDPEAMEVNEGFLTALEYAMPPTGGLGIGVDRLVMMLTGTSIRQTLAFPFARPQA